MYNDEPCIRVLMKCFYFCALKEIPRPFASTVELPVGKGFNFSLEGLGLGVSRKLILCLNCVDEILFNISVSQSSGRRGVQFYLEISFLRNRKCSLDGSRKQMDTNANFHSGSENTEFLGGRIKSLGA